jgi:xylan 1,4-beta-xylosidase
MADEEKAATGRRDFLKTSALFAVGAGASQLAPTSASAATGPSAAALGPPQARTSSGKVPLIGVDMRLTYTNPINLPYIEVRALSSAMAATDEAIADSTTMLPVLEKDRWVEADGRTLTGRAKTGFRVLTENAFRTAADFTPLNVDGTIYLYASGGLGGPNNSRTAWSTTDYLTWTVYEMNMGVTAPTAVRVGNKFYMAGNGSPIYVADSPVGPWTEFGRFTKSDGTELRPSDVQFFLDTDGRLYLTYNIGAPIMGVELDSADPRRVLTEPVVVWDFDPLQEWQHFGDNKQSFAHGYVEGSQMFKVGNRYYISVASGGTEHTTYATGVMTSTRPLQGFRPLNSQVNPIGYAPGGNVPSALYPNAGHGSFVIDGAGRLMFFYTYVIAYEQGFERRLGVDVCEVTREGAINCRLSNTPRLAPGKEVSGQDDVGLYNLSTLTSAYWASSYAPGRTPYYAGDRTLSTWWEPADRDAAPTYIMGFANAYYISAAQIHWKEIGFRFTAKNAVRYTLEYRDIASNAWRPLVDRSENTTPYTADYTTFDRVLTHAVRLKILGTTENVKVGVQQLNVFGENYTLAREKGLIS